MRVPFVDLVAQYESISRDVDAAIKSVILDAAFIGGKYAKKFEEEFAEFCCARHCIGVGNGTDALYIALRALGVGAGDEVITAANSFIASSEAITMTGARVVFVDNDPDTYNISVKGIKRAITDKTRAIVPIHLFGLPADVPTIKKLADEHGLFLVEDAAQAHGATIFGQSLGTQSHATCYSFYPGKVLGAYGDAGAIVTNDQGLAEQARMIANHGRKEKYNHEFEGVNSRLDGIQAAILSVKLPHVAEWVEGRRRVAAVYRRQLDGSGLVLPTEPEGYRHVYHVYVVRLAANRDKVIADLKAQGIACNIHYPIALPNLDAYRYLGHALQDFPVSTAFSSQVLSLPMYPELTQDMLDYVCEQVVLAVRDAGRERSR